MKHVHKYEAVSVFGECRCGRLVVGEFPKELEGKFVVKKKV